MTNSTSLLASVINCNHDHIPILRNKTQYVILTYLSTQTFTLMSLEVNITEYVTLKSEKVGNFIFL